MYIKRLELCNFKSFGGATQVPLLPGFTVVSGPNGSGKSNILDALLFALGLSTSKGMRAERLPDLVNHQQSTRGRATVEASVTVTFELGDAEPSSPGAALPPSLEWSVTRKLRVTPQGTYTSTYAINGEPCTLNDLHEQLHELRIYPEGYNVVLQGDVTSIISMPPRERRQIIDELAGVAAFDRKITQAKEKLDAVKERQESCRIIERELTEQRDRLAQDRVQAEKYQKLRTELETKSQWEVVIGYRQLAAQVQQLRSQIQADEQVDATLSGQLAALSAQVEGTTVELEGLNNRVRALGEEEYLGLQATLATHEAELRQLQRQQEELTIATQETATLLLRTQGELQEHWQTLANLTQEYQTIASQDLVSLQASRDEAQQSLHTSREAASNSAAHAEVWVQQQTTLHQQIATLLQTLDPQRTEQAQLRERVHQLQRQIQEQTQQGQRLDQEVEQKQQTLTAVLTAQETTAAQAIALAETLWLAEETLQVQQQTQTRLVQEQREKQRQLDKLEAQAQAIQEGQGTFATKVILQAGLPGVCGLVAHLGRVDPRYQLALEVSAGARLGNLVVEDDGVAAAGIELLKQKRAGRVTFLPLNKIQGPKPLSIPPWQRLEGMVDLAVNLLACDRRYEAIFAYVLGNTLVFDQLQNARRHLGQFRMVTLGGDLLESTGAMTGGSAPTNQTLRLGTVTETESSEIRDLSARLQELEAILDRSGQAIQQIGAEVQQRSRELIEVRQHQREHQRQVTQLQSELQQLQKQQSQLHSQLSQNHQGRTQAQTRLQELDHSIPTQEVQLEIWQQSLTELEQSQTHSQWQQIQANIRIQEAQLNGWELVLRNTEQRLQELENQRQLVQEKIQQAQTRLEDYRSQQVYQSNQAATLSQQQSTVSTQAAQTQGEIATLEQTLGEAKQARDQVERQLREQQQSQQQSQWQWQKLQETQHQRHEQLTQLQVQVQTLQPELPDPLPEIPSTLSLDQLQPELRSLQKRIQAMEPVNMLALEEYDRTQTRLQELSDKLTTLESERTELLLRIENFTTLRQRAFQEAFEAVNENFQSIFAILSDGDGSLQLDDPQDPATSGLNLIAHPKGKPVQRLASMSGGEKSLTALSFIFALQRYRPSPFYAFDEVDMFLDGSNVERLAKMIKQQAQQAQFIVVSLRRPMMESAERTIGVTQARGAYTQVLGLQLQPQAASV
ncbi:chromosome segregation protein SMC [Neosynechococcus sphagnicola sy1]|uniref:Chromosome partition protein Smc n=1 Tax=Neosynechococcus sphagnicola sy1 TaxID=1497020 RepID=A0A098TPT2_9CYAN|nr:chromosome segregation protein SMC [Neosynechococcus sphagnicola sy1]